MAVGDSGCNRNQNQYGTQPQTTPTVKCTNKVNSPGRV